MIIGLRILYLFFIGYMIYRMVKGGGCCGGHRHQGHKDSKIDEKKTITEEEKKKAIDVI
ncbi:hypothetical protein [Geosporobacter ferrireducens]|uniref:hypothetical protein n=1 Tax=Geosporobacter ferrireducens TaxID=1424294 RepID=UPI0023568162|nr:hypothetical protein [Geosporobacter ferrireducens]